MRNRPGQLVLVAALLASGCDRVDGSGRSVIDVRELPAFEAVEVRAGLQAEIAHGLQSVMVHGDDNIVPHVLTSVRDRVLRIEPGRDLNPSAPLRISVRLPKLVAASLQAGGRLTLDEITSPELALSLEAGGELLASGNVGKLTVRLSAGGALDATALPAASVTLQGNAGGLMSVTAIDEVDGLVESGTEAHVFGQPLRRAVRTASGGTVQFD